MLKKPTIPTAVVMPIESRTRKKKLLALTPSIVMFFLALPTRR
jgi:hypothetical protein